MTRKEYNSCRKRVLAGTSGFTLLEVILVIFIIGIVTATVLSRIPSVNTYTERTETDTLKSHLRYAQNKAMNTNKNWGVNFSATTDYRLYSKKSDGTTQYHYFPSQENTATVSLSVLRIQGGTNIEFDALGSPTTGAVSIKNTGGVTLFTVSAETGFIG